ncbi:MAG: cytochrome B5 [Chloroflexi bacterium]|nr:cytochrome B5 [Chloroflexota bacterium]
MARFDGKDGRLAYVAYEGTVYDVSSSALWEGGEHQGDHLAGRDLTADMKGAPHDVDTLQGFPVVGKLV